MRRHVVRPDVVDDWPGDDAVAIALAARIVMLAAASRVCSVGRRTRHESMLLHLIEYATDVSGVQGAPFERFLSTVATSVSHQANEAGVWAAQPALAEAMRGVEYCPVDVIGETYKRLVQLSSPLFARWVGEPLAPKLRRD